MTTKMTGAVAKQTIELDEATAEKFKHFCKHEAEIDQILKAGVLDVTAHTNWKQLYDFAHKMQFGQVMVTFKDSVPVRVDNPMQTIIFKL